MTESNTTTMTTRPWGVVIGMIMGAFTTLVCVARGIEPMVILQRVCVASTVAGMVGSLGVRTLNAIVPPQRSSRRREQSKS